MKVAVGGFGAMTYSALRYQKTMNFHEYLKSLIKERNLTQKAIAKTLETDTAYFSELLNNRHDFLPSCKTLESLSRVLQCTDERIELFRLAGKMPPELRMAFCSFARDAKE